MSLAAYASYALHYLKVSHDSYASLVKTNILILFDFEIFLNITNIPKINEKNIS